MAAHLEVTPAEVLVDKRGFVVPLRSGGWEPTGRTPGLQNESYDLLEIIFAPEPTFLPYIGLAQKCLLLTTMQFPKAVKTWLPSILGETE